MFRGDHFRALADKRINDVIVWTNPKAFDVATEPQNLNYTRYTLYAVTDFHCLLSCPIKTVEQKWTFTSGLMFNVFCFLVQITV